MESKPNVDLFLANQAWQWRRQGNQINVKICPLCSNESYKFFINPESGMWDCKVCSKSGNLYTLKQAIGDSTMEGEITSANG